MNTGQRLGYGKEERLLIVNADDLGLCRSVNEGVLQLLSEKAVCSATIMMTCPWSVDAAELIQQQVPNADIGVHWTLTSEWPRYKWGPISRKRSLTTLANAAGWFPSTIVEVEVRSDPEEVRTELMSQVEAALKAGLSLTHADNHMGSLYGFLTGRDLLLVAFDVCASYGLPFRLPRYLLPAGGRSIPTELQALADTRVRQAEDRGIVLPDYVTGFEYGSVDGETYDVMKAEGIGMIRGLLPGVTEWISHPSKVTYELKAFHDQWEKRGWEQRFWTDEDVKSVLAQEGIQMIGWKDLQRLQTGISF